MHNKERIEQNLIFTLADSHRMKKLLNLIFHLFFPGQVVQGHNASWAKWIQAHGKVWDQAHTGAKKSEEARFW